MLKKLGSAVPKSTCHKILKLKKMHRYKIQELDDCDLDRRVEFCEIMPDMIRKNRNVLWSDESWFYFNDLIKQLSILERR